MGVVDKLELSTRVDRQQQAGDTLPKSVNRELTRARAVKCPAPKYKNDLTQQAVFNSAGLTHKDDYLR